MTRLLHISDLHFGRVHAPALVATEALIATTSPDLVVISGDITQRARHREYAAAAAFVGAIPCPVVAVPGNHDLPFHNVVERVVAPWRRFERAVGAASQSAFHVASSDAGAGVDVLGLNTVQVLAIEDGALRAESPDAIRAHFSAKHTPRRGPPAIPALRVVVVHHPSVPPLDHPQQRCLEGAQRFIDVCDDAGVDLILSGHVHLPRVTPRPRRSGGLALHIQCGTTTSDRFRGEDNAAVIVDVDGVNVTTAVWTCRGSTFSVASERRWHRSLEGLGASSVG